MSCINIFEGPIIVQQMYIHKVDDVHLYSLNKLLEKGNLTLILQRVPFNSFFLKRFMLKCTFLCSILHPGKT